MKLNERQAGWLAYLLHEVRDDWAAGSMKSMFLEADVPSLPALILAATTKALEPSCKTPAPILLGGPHWPEQARADLPPPEHCKKHPSYYAHNCGGCRFEHLEPQAVPTGAASVIEGDET